MKEFQVIWYRRITLRLSFLFCISTQLQIVHCNTNLFFFANHVCYHFFTKFLQDSKSKIQDSNQLTSKRRRLASRVGFVLRQFMVELRELESAEGMALNIPDLPNFRIRGTIVSVCGDTKEAHEIGVLWARLLTNFVVFASLIDQKLIWKATFISCFWEIGQITTKLSCLQTKMLTTFQKPE